MFFRHRPVMPKMALWNYRVEFVAFSGRRYVWNTRVFWADGVKPSAADVTKRLGPFADTLRASGVQVVGVNISTRKDWVYFGGIS